MTAHKKNPWLALFITSIAIGILYPTLTLPNWSLKDQSDYIWGIKVMVPHLLFCLFICASLNLNKIWDTYFTFVKTLKYIRWFYIHCVILNLICLDSSGLNLFSKCDQPSILLTLLVSCFFFSIFRSCNFFIVTTWVKV